MPASYPNQNRHNPETHILFSHVEGELQDWCEAIAERDDCPLEIAVESDASPTWQEHTESDFFITSPRMVLKGIVSRRDFFRAMRGEDLQNPSLQYMPGYIHVETAQIISQDVASDAA